MKAVFIFAGTSEGRLLSETLSESGFDCTVSVATEYGAKLLPKSEKIEVLQGRMSAEQMTECLSRKKYAFVIDATHPFAVEVSKEIKKACNCTKIRRLRLARDCQGENPGDIFYFDSTEEAAEWLEKQAGKIFVSTGSKELPVLARKISDKSRLLVRVLPSIESLKICEECGVVQKQIIAMQGPFSEKANEIQFEESGAKILLTKESGKAGGYFEKISVAQRLGMKIAVIKNPEKTDEGGEVFHSLEEICAILKKSE